LANSPILGRPILRARPSPPAAATQTTPLPPARAGRRWFRL